VPNVVGTDTLLEGDLPEGVANYGSLATFAAKTEEDWEDELRGNEETRWGDGFLGGLFEGLAEGKPFIAALIEAILIEVFPEYEQAVEDAETAFADLASLFNGRWRDLVNAKNAADYANAQLAVSNRPIRDLFDGTEGDLDTTTLWDIDYFDSVGGLAGGEVAQDGEGNAWWDGFGISGRAGRCRYKDVATVTDDQIATIVMPLKVQPPALLTGQSYMRILLRVNADNDDAVYAEITDDDVKIGYLLGGTADEWASTSVATQDGDVWDFFCEGTLFTIKRDGLVVLEYDDVAGEAEMDSDHRFVGFEMFAASRGLLGQTSPGTLAVFSADDY
jgi:hypothetical protein